MAVTITNIIVGPCQSMVYDGVDLGATSGGVQVVKNRSFYDIRTEYVPFPIGKVLKEEVYSVKTYLAEATMQNLAIVWGDLIENDNLITLGANWFDLSTHTLVFTGPGPNGKARTFTLNNVVSMTTDGPVMTKENVTLIPVEFAILPVANSSGQFDLGTIEEN